MRKVIDNELQLAWASFVVINTSGHSTAHFTRGIVVLDTLSNHYLLLLLLIATTMNDDNITDIRNL